MSESRRKSGQKNGKSDCSRNNHSLQDVRFDCCQLLTKVVQEQQRAMQEQQKTISNLREELNELKVKVK